MKLLFELPEIESIVLKNNIGEGERVLYCVPFDFHEEKRVSGYMVFTEKKIYKILVTDLLATYELSHLSGFTVDVMLGVCGFYAKNDGVSTLLCQFISGRNLARYSVMVAACERLASGDLQLVESNEPESYCPKCGRPFVKNTQICPFCQSKTEVYKKLFAMTKGLRFMMIFPLIVTAVALMIRFIVPFFQKTAINEYITNSGRSDDYMTHFLLIIAAIVTFDLISRILNVIKSRLSAIAGNRFIRMMRTLLFEKIQMLSMSSISQKSAGDLMGRISSDVVVVQDFITNQLPNYFSYLLSFIVALILLLCLNPLMCLFVFVPMPFVIFVIIKLRGHFHMKIMHRWRKRQKINRYLQDVISGIRVVKSFGNEEREIDSYVESNEEYFDRDMDTCMYFDTLFPVLSFVLKLGSFMILGFGNYLLFGGGLLVGDLNQYTTYANIAYEPLMQITQIPRVLSNFITSLSKVLEILEEEPEIYDANIPKHNKIKGDVSIKNVYFGYDSYNPVLKDVSVEIKQGEMIGIVGHSGCGKTTLINMLMRLYDPNEGSITIDGIDLRDMSQESLRSQIGVVLQETHLFAGSVRDNIRYAKPYATNEEIIAAARTANAHDFIMNLPEGYNTMVGEKGFSLSGGERQRIAIARALIHDPRILILDEATAALDTETEKLIQDAINKMTEGRTTFAIAHRLSTLRNADKILVLDHGRVKEYGTHVELLEKKGIYYKLVMAQAQAALGEKQ
ncbi:MAG: ATP-binding cassette domain-containing protein [Clostridia bacterium]|nr:ATP-binding cassette domain-containing protein [Clostridia bacterium]